jgi:hypothetical protein
MILLVTPLERADDCAAALLEATGEPVVIASSLLDATTRLRTESFSAAVFDQYQIEQEPLQTEIAFAHLGTAIPVEVNLAICGMDRLVRTVQAALARRQREETAARQAAACALHNESNGILTDMLFHCDLALAITGLPPAAAHHLTALRDLAQKFCTQFASGQTNDSMENGRPRPPKASVI